MNKIKQVKTEQWPVWALYQKAINERLIKPKYQRKKKWLISLDIKKNENTPNKKKNENTPNKKKNENTPNMKNYILFLIYTKNSVHSTTINSLEDDKYAVTDGNNRINALVTYIQTPFKIFPEYLSDIFNFINNNIKLMKMDNNDKETIKKVITEMSYDDVITFKYKEYFKNKNCDTIYTSYLSEVRDDFEVLFEKLEDKLKIDGKRFDDIVFINVNIFEGYTSDEMANVFNSINRYNSSLTYLEIAASRLLNKINFEITNKLLNLEIKECIAEFYKDRSNDEVLPCYMYDKEEHKMNAYDFIVGFQNLANQKNEMFDKCDNDHILFFNLWKLLYDEDDGFTTENINQFISYIEQIINIFNTLKLHFSCQLVKKSKNINNDTLYKKCCLLGENAKLIILSIIIGCINKNIDQATILKYIKIALIYNIFINDLNNKDNKKKFRIDDIIHAEAGGEYIKNKAKEHLKNPNLIMDKIYQQPMEELIKNLILDNIKVKTFELRENGKNKSNDKRRERKNFENVLIQSYYKSKVPTSYLNEEYSLEHIAPFSSSWEDNVQIDIDRLGNVIPIINRINLKRSNNHISAYKNADKTEFLRYLEDIIPSNNEYDEIVCHKNRKPNIINSNKFNEKCMNNEKILINNFLEELFK